MKRMRIHSVVLCVLIFLTLLLKVQVLKAQSTVAQDYELRVPSLVQFSYDPFSGLPGSESFVIEVHNLTVNGGDTDDDQPDNRQPDDSQSDENLQQQVVLSIQPLDAGSFNLIGKNLQLPVELVANNQASITRVDQGYAGPIILDSANTPSSLVEFDVKLLESIFADADLYTLELEVALLDIETNELIGSPRLMTIEVSVLQKLQTNIAGAKGRYEDGLNFAVIDFGQLQTGEQQQVFIQVRGNTDAKITVSSENKGRMLNKENPKLYVDYKVDIDGEVSDLEVPLNLARPVAKDLQGSAYPMTVTIGDVSSSFSGAYQDIIQVDVSPQ